MSVTHIDHSDALGIRDTDPPFAFQDNWPDREIIFYYYYDEDAARAATSDETVLLFKIKPKKNA